jgi:hypothetical protein
VARDLGVNEGTLGNWVARAPEAREGTDGLSTGDIEELKRLRAAIAERLAEVDPDNTLWQRRLGYGHGSVGELWQAVGNHEEAENSYRAALAASERAQDADLAAVVSVRLAEVLTQAGRSRGCRSQSGRGRSCVGPSRRRSKRPLRSWPRTGACSARKTSPDCWVSSSARGLSRSC